MFPGICATKSQDGRLRSYCCDVGKVEKQASITKPRRKCDAVPDNYTTPSHADSTLLELQERPKETGLPTTYPSLRTASAQDRIECSNCERAVERDFIPGRGALDQAWRTPNEIGKGSTYMSDKCVYIKN